MASGPRISVQRAVTLALVAIAAGVTGITLYVLNAPDVDIVAVELGGAAQRLPPNDVVQRAMAWDLVLIAGYGSALLLGCWVAGRVFWAKRMRELAGTGLRLAVVAISADLLEDAALSAASASSGPGWLSVGLLLDIAVCLAVLKFCCLVPAALVAVAGVVVALARALAWSQRPREREDPHRWPGAVDVVPAWPIEGDLDPSAALMEEGEGGGAARWRHGYRIPDAQSVVKEARSGTVIGMCLSGGGVRSASVALGALQSLRTELLRARYLVSVSGGGYTAGALQLAVTATGHPETDGDGLRDAGSVLMPGTVDEDRVRRHASYLADSPAEMITALGVLARGVLASVFVLFSPALVLGVATGLAYSTVPLVDWRDESLRPDATQVSFPDIPSGSWSLLLALALLSAIFFGWHLGRVAYARTPGTHWWLVAKRTTQLSLVVAGFAVVVPALAFASAWVLSKTDGDVAIGGSFASLLLAYGTTLVAFGRRPKVRKRFGGLLGRGSKGKGTSPAKAVPAGLLQLLLVVLTTAVLAIAWLLLYGGAAAATDGWHAGMLWPTLIVAAGLVVVGGVLDQTWLSLHPFYRRRLSSAFAARRIRRKDGHVTSKGYDFTETTTLSKYGQRVSTATGRLPEVVFAAAANLSGERRAPLKAVSYTFSGNWVGGPDIGYVRTSHLERVMHDQFRRDLTVQAAVATSGAAVASAMGRSGRWFATLLAVTGARLGTWLPNPGFILAWSTAARDTSKDWTVPAPPRLRRLPYLVREVLGIHRSTDRLLQITDGGHYENLGLVELFRRRCTEIWCIDASGDSPPAAGTLSAALRLAEEELGVQVQLPKTSWELVPGSAAPLEPKSPLADLSSRLSKRAAVAATFTYPVESGLGTRQKPVEGRLVVAKALLTPDMDYDLLAYATNHPVFPHDSTGDQFFDDDKYLGYTALGREIGEQAREAMKALDDSQCPAPSTWWRRRRSRSAAGEATSPRAR